MPMKRIFSLAAFFIIFSFYGFAQEITNVIYVDANNNITENIKEMQFFIIIKKLKNGSYERLNYGNHTALQSVQTYSDSSLTVLEGKNLKYDTEGKLTVLGNYNNNQKNKTWYYYNDTFKVIKKEIYQGGLLTETIDPDTVKTQEKIKYSDEKQAEFKGGSKSFIKYLTSKMNANVALNSVKGGKVLVAFTINKDGDALDFYMRKSVEFVLDEEALRVLYKMPKWIPSFQNGEHINAYRVQPITFVKVE